MCPLVRVRAVNSDAFKYRLKKVMGDKSNRSFASECDISEMTLRRYLAEETFPPLDTLEKIAAVAGCSLAWLASGEGDMKRGTVNEAAPGWEPTNGHPASKSTPDAPERPLGWFYEWLEDELRDKSVTEIMRFAVKIKAELDKDKDKEQ